MLTIKGGALVPTMLLYPSLTYCSRSGGMYLDTETALHVPFRVFIRGIVVLMESGESWLLAPFSRVGVGTPYTFGSGKHHTARRVSEA